MGPPSPDQTPAFVESLLSCMHPSTFTCELKLRRDGQLFAELSARTASAMEDLQPYQHIKTGKWYFSLLRPLSKILVCMPVLSQSCDFCNTIQSQDPLQESLHLIQRTAKASSDNYTGLRSLLSVVHNHSPAALSSPAGGMFQFFPPCSPKTTSSPSASIVLFFRDQLCHSTNLQVVFQKWCDASLVFTWFSISPSRIAQFVHDMVIDIRDLMNQVERDNVQVFPDVKWAQALTRALGVVRQASPLPLACPLNSDQPDLPLSKYLADFPSIVMPTYSPLAQSWNCDWSALRFKLRNLVLGATCHCASFMIPTTVTSHQHVVLTRLLRLHVTCLGTSFPASACVSGTGCQCTLWVAHKHPLPRDWLSQVFYTLRGLCEQSGAVLSPEVFSPLFANPSVCDPVAPLAHPHTAPRPLFSELWTTEVDERRTALAPRWNPATRKLVTTKNWSKIFRSWDRLNNRLHECTAAHARKIHTNRLGDFSVFTEGCWIYVLWCLRDHRVYIGQTGGRQYLRRVCDRGAEHVRLAMDYLRLSGGGKIFLPRSVYR